jgi:hypothetical protein
MTERTHDGAGVPMAMAYLLWVIVVAGLLYGIVSTAANVAALFGG